MIRRVLSRLGALPKTRLGHAAALAGAILAVNMASRAEHPSPILPQHELDRRPIISVEKLGAMRAGLRVAGLEFNVGAQMRTLVDGKVVLESRIDLGSLGGQPTVLHADLSGGYGRVITLYGEVQGIEVNDRKGSTQVIHDLTRDQFSLTVINRADQRQIQTELDINVTLENFSVLQAAGVRNRIIRSLGGALSF
jgi:hypothetical protein